MKEKNLISLSILVLLVAGIVIVRNQANSTTLTTNTISSSASKSVIPADKIEVVHFHGTEQCISCIAVGKFALQTIEEKFPKEYKSGKIVFREINGELPENNEIVMKYQARGSSLFVNAIRGENDNILEDVTVWRLINDEQQFVSYFEKKLNGLLGR